MLVTQQGQSSRIGRKVGTGVQREAAPSASYRTSRVHQLRLFGGRKTVKVEENTYAMKTRLKCPWETIQTSELYPKPRISFLSIRHPKKRRQNPPQREKTTYFSASSLFSFWLRSALSWQPFSSASRWICRILAITPSTLSCISCAVSPSCLSSDGQLSADQTRFSYKERERRKRGGTNPSRQIFHPGRIVWIS